MTARTALALAAALALSGCARREITAIDRAQAANMTSEAEFAATVREWGRAEGLYAQAAALCPDSGDTWLALGITRMRLGNRSGARDAYKAAASAYKSAFAGDPTNSQAVAQQAYALVILGRQDEARSVAQRARRDHPDDALLHELVDGGGLERVIADPGLKEISP
jgi:tetratricopeptide (TPR) repeat protein